MSRAIPFRHVGLALALPAAGAAQQLPVPTGPAAVGTVTYEWTDSSRAEVVEFLAPERGSGRLTPLPAQGRRTLFVQLWYPAVRPEGSAASEAAYNPEADAFTGAISDTARIALYRATRTHAWAGATLVPGGRLPVLLFSPGGGAFRADYTALYEDLASHGYVVAAVSHPGITSMSLGSGRIAAEWRGWRPPPGLSMSLEPDSLRVSSRFFAETRDRFAVGDVRFVLDQLQELDRGGGDRRFAGRLDLGRVGALGHSTGGAVVAAAAQADPRIRAVLVYDVILPRLLFEERLNVPLMLFRTDDTRYPPGWSELQVETFAHLDAGGYDVLLRGGGHNSFSDRALLSPTRFPYRLDPRRATEVIRRYTRGFFDTHLLGKPPSLLVDGESDEVRVAVTPVHPG